ncbi:MAG: hypothetical protein K0Q79_3499 [Flavipsychrobacter sp.]|jgi:hypothetical protein|nr:hypothetical protein [Flavipsychrobacter sp.]
MAAHNNKMGIIWSYLAILISLLPGIGILVVSEKIPLPSWIAPPVVVFALFVLLNVTFCFLLQLKRELNEYWNLQKAVYLSIAFVAGCIIAALPAILAIITGKAATGDVVSSSTFRLPAFALRL